MADLWGVDKTILKDIMDIKTSEIQGVAALKEIIDNPYNRHDLPDNLIIYDPATSLYSLREKYNILCSTLDKLEKGHVVRLADKTIVPENPYKPKKELVMALGIVLGLFLGIFAAFFMEWLTNVRSRADQGSRF